MKWVARPSFFEHRWSGWRVWLGEVWFFSVIAGSLSELVPGSNAQAVLDVLHIAFVWPLVTTGLVMLMAGICVRLWQVSWKSTLAYLETLLPFILLVPGIQLIERWSGLYEHVAFVNFRTALGSFFTGGLFPAPTAPLGVAVVWLGVCVWVGWSWWHITPKHTVRELFLACAPGYFCFVGFWLVPSLIGWAALVGSVPLWNADSALVEHGFVVTQIDGYAWRSVYERFPFALGGEAHISSQWLFSTLLLLLGFALYMVMVQKTWCWSWKGWWRYAEASRIQRVVGTVGLGFCIATVLETHHLFGWTQVLALLELFIATTLFVLAQAADVDLAKAMFGLLPPDRPLSSGAVSAAELGETKQVWRIMGYALAWWLGFPVLAAFVIADLTHHRSIVAREAFAFLGWSTLSIASLFLAGWMVQAERGSFGGRGPACALLVSLLYFGWNWMRNRQNT